MICPGVEIAQPRANFFLIIEFWLGDSASLLVYVVCPACTRQ